MRKYFNFLYFEGKRIDFGASKLRLRRLYIHTYIHILILPVKTERSRLISSLLYGNISKRTMTRNKRNCPNKRIFLKVLKYAFHCGLRMRVSFWPAHAHLVFTRSCTSPFVLRMRISFWPAHAHLVFGSACISHFGLRMRIWIWPVFWLRMCSFYSSLWRTSDACGFRVRVCTAISDTFTNIEKLINVWKACATIICKTCLKSCVFFNKCLFLKFTKNGLESVWLKPLHWSKYFWSNGHLTNPTFEDMLSRSCFCRNPNEDNNYTFEIVLVLE